MVDYRFETEADTRATRIDPALAAAGWGQADAPVQREVIALGRITQAGKRINPMSADYVLHHKGRKLAVIEAKRASVPTAEGVGQAKEYARRLNTRFAYATNGHRIIEIGAVALALAVRIHGAYGSLEEYDIDAADRGEDR